MIRYLESKSTIVAGATCGIGKATALLFAKEGASVVLADVDEAAQDVLDTIRSSGQNSWFIPADVTEAKAVKVLMDKAAQLMGGIHVLVNNAGRQLIGDIGGVDDTAWDVQMQVNARSCFFGY